VTDWDEKREGRCCNNKTIVQSPDQQDGKPFDKLQRRRTQSGTGGCNGYNGVILDWKKSVLWTQTGKSALALRILVRGDPSDSFADIVAPVSVAWHGDHVPGFVKSFAGFRSQRESLKTVTTDSRPHRLVSLSNP